MKTCRDGRALAEFWARAYKAGFGREETDGSYSRQGSCNYVALLAVRRQSATCQVAVGTRERGAVWAKRPLGLVGRTPPVHQKKPCASVMTEALILRRWQIL